MQVLYERSKRDASSSESDVSSSDDSSSESDDSSSSDSDVSSSESDASTDERDDITTESDDITTERSDDITTTETDTTTPVDECALLGDFIESDVTVLPFVGSNSLLNFTLIIQTAQRFFDLLTSAPMVFGNFSLAINAALDQIMIPPFFPDPANSAARDAVGLMFTDFVTLANDACGIELNATQTGSAINLFVFLLPRSVALSQECNVLNVTIIEQAAASANITDFDNNLQNLISDAVGFPLFLSSVIVTGTQPVIFDTPADMRAAVAQTLLDEFLFFINDFCGVPPLSNATLTQLDDYFLVDALEFAILVGA